MNNCKNLSGIILALAVVLLTCFLLTSFQVFPSENNSNQIAGKYPCLNEGLVCRAEPRAGDPLSEHFPEEVKYTAKISVADDSKWLGKLGDLYWFYWIKGKVTKKKMRLMEYHFLIRITILKWIIPVDILNNYMDQEEIVQYGVKVSRGWFLSRDMKVPDYPKVKAIHQLFIEATQPAGPYIHKKSDIYPNMTTTYRSLSAVGLGGFPGVGYNSSYTQKRIAEAKYKLYELLKEFGIRPN